MRRRTGAPATVNLSVIITMILLIIILIVVFVILLMVEPPAGGFVLREAGVLREASFSARLCSLRLF